MGRSLLLGAALAWALSLSACLSIPTDTFGCTTAADCPSGMQCSGGLCSDQPPVSCRVDLDCPAGEVCGTGGTCTTTCATPSNDRGCTVFYCYNGMDTVRLNQLCDGVPNCPNDGASLGSPFDETTCLQCMGGTVHYYTQCDGVADCTDKSDEFACFKCPMSGEVVKQSWICDGTADCTDGTDEANCTPFICGPPDPDIDRALVCNGKNDCPTTMADENAGLLVTCDDFLCSDGMTVANEAWRCDGWVDCPDGADERPPNCMTICLDGTRRPPGTRCDGNPDCPMGEDEMNCPP